MRGRELWSRGGSGHGRLCGFLERHDGRGRRGMHFGHVVVVAFGRTFQGHIGVDGRFR